MSQDDEQSTWWVNLTADDACCTETNFNDLIHGNDCVDVARVCQLWCLLYALGKHEEMRDFLAAIERMKPNVTMENIGVGRAWINKYQPVLSALKKLKEMMSNYPGDYASLDKCVNSLSEIVDSFNSEINQILIRKRAPRYKPLQRQRPPSKE